MTTNLIVPINGETALLFTLSADLTALSDDWCCELVAAFIPDTPQNVITFDNLKESWKSKVKGYDKITEDCLSVLSDDRPVSLTICRYNTLDGFIELNGPVMFINS